MTHTIENTIQISGINNNLPKYPYIFKQFSLQNDLILPEEKPDISHLIRIMADTHIIQTKFFSTHIAQSLTKQNLTGKALFIEGEIKEKIEYTADVLTQVVHGVEFIIPFTTFIILPKDYIINTPINTTSYIKNISLSLINQRSIFESIDLFIDSTLCH